MSTVIDNPTGRGPQSKLRARNARVPTWTYLRRMAE